MEKNVLWIAIFFKIRYLYTYSWPLFKQNKEFDNNALEGMIDYAFEILDCCGYIQSSDWSWNRLLLVDFRILWLVLQPTTERERGLNASIPNDSHVIMWSCDQGRLKSYWDRWNTAVYFLRSLRKKNIYNVLQGKEKNSKVWIICRKVPMKNMRFMEHGNTYFMTHGNIYFTKHGNIYFDKNYKLYKHIFLKALLLTSVRNVYSPTFKKKSVQENSSRQLTC